MSASASDSSSGVAPPENVDVPVPHHHQPALFTPNDPTVFSDDDHSGDMGMMDRDYTGVFEGPEKTLEVCFRKVKHPEDICTAGEATEEELSAVLKKQGTRKSGLRQLQREDIDRICARARCTILSSVSNQYLDAYVLSESSLFIYPYMLILKTCGTTTLLRCIATLIELGRKLRLEIDWVGYSRKNFNFPGDQAFPHQSFHQELDYLYSHKSLCDRLDGNGYTLGPVTDDHWFVFVADQTNRAKALDIETDRVLNIMMFDIDEEVAKIFYYGAYETREGETNDEEVARISNTQTSECGIDKLCPGSTIDARAFEPCGYSMNAILFRSYCTMHITPETGSSYASFETNQKLASFNSLVSNVIRTFRPKRFVMTLMADEGALIQMKENPLDEAKMALPYSSGCEPMSYRRSSLASIKVEDDCCCMMANFIMDKNPRSSTRGSVTLSELGEANPRASKVRGMSVS